MSINRKRYNWKPLAVVVAALIALAASFAAAERADMTQPYSTTKTRVINAGNPQKWDTLAAVPTGYRTLLVSLAVALRDSNAAAGLDIVFASKNSATTYVAFHDSLSAGQRKHLFFSGPIAFPTDSTIKISYFTTVGVIDTIYAMPTYRIEQAP